jgi:transcriptional regulator with XRE-family HTH domain
MGANVHHDEDRRRPRNRQRGNDPSKRDKSPGGSRDDYYPDHRTPLNAIAILCITFHSPSRHLLSVVRRGWGQHPRFAWRAQCGRYRRTGGFAVKRPPRSPGFFRTIMSCLSGRRRNEIHPEAFDPAAVQRLHSDRGRRPFRRARTTKSTWVSMTEQPAPSSSSSGGYRHQPVRGAYGAGADRRRRARPPTQVSRRYSGYRRPTSLRPIRETAGLTRPQLADAIGVGSSAIKKYETGLVQISDERAAQITAACRNDAAAFWSATERAKPQAGYFKSRAANRSTDDDEYTANGEGLGGLASWLIPVGALLAIGLVAVLSVQDAA